jgi:hypothetical protein
MFGRLRSLFSDKDKSDSEPDHRWNAMESMDPRNSLVRLQQLNLNSQQFPVVKGLLDGSISPADQPGVADWCHSQEVSSTGLDALTYALQIALASDGTTYVFPTGQQGPAAMLPKLTTNTDLTIVVSHMDGTPVTSLDELLSCNGIIDYSVEILTPSKLRRRVTCEPSFARDRLDRGAIPSVTIEKRADDQQRLLEPFELTELVDAINRELGYNLTPDELTIEDGRIDQFGLFTCIAQVDSITKKKIKFWVVPKIELDPKTES